MKLILTSDVGNLGEMGAIVNVAPGYARNYLLPKNFAVEANTRNIKVLDHTKRIIEEKVKKLKLTAKELADKLSAQTIILTAKAGEEGKLFGSITNKDIAEALEAKGFNVDKKRIILENPIKRIGSHHVKIRIHTDITAELNVEVNAE
ncbi:MAG: 50S ribosomal protein L9 [Nitrospirae bacterium]|nr:50S ribosomal protein L9 [Nitrospirota bacterium]